MPNTIDFLKVFKKSPLLGIYIYMSNDKDKDPLKKKKRGRKPKKKVDEEETKVPKKRGRKPRGGKIIKKTTDINVTNSNIEANIILHLKCNTSDIKLKGNSMLNNKYNPEISHPDPFSLTSNQKLTSLPFESLTPSVSTNNVKQRLNQLPGVNFKETLLSSNNTMQSCVDNSHTTQSKHTTSHESDSAEEDINIKTIWKKLSNLKHQLRYNSLPDKRSSCFWCTCGFDNPAIYIPSKIRNKVYDVYGCFCSPQCAVAFLRNEPLDHSVLWERYSMINDLYGKIFGKNIKPAPCPYYTLNKYYGNLTIQEYRKLLNNDKLLMIVDKPMSKILPELYEDNNELPNVNNNLLSKGVSNTEYRLKSNHLKREKRNIFSSV